jgi:DNA-binding CsgD family transcriptional regulator
MLTEARLLSPLVDAHLAASDHERALAAAERLRALARSTSRLVGAYAALASARLALATGDELGGREQAMRSLEAFGALAMPHEAAAARLELARSLVAELPELAREEAQAAWGVYKELGARSGMDAAALVLRRLGRRPAGDLTPRESEVLELVARGLTNAAIAQTLFISEKTAGHHVSRILSKLGARNRAEAAVRAAQLRE